MLEIKNLCVTHGDFSLIIDNLDISNTNYFMIMGISGSGKSTFLEAIAGFYNTIDAKITLDGVRIENLSPKDRKISLLHQRPCLFKNLSVFENIAYGLRCKHKKEAEIKKEVYSILERFNITNLLSRDIRELSGGEALKVSLARSIIVKPKILLLDEPLRSLDRISRMLIIKELEKIKNNKQMIIHVTHNLQDSFYLADKVAIMNSGKITQYMSKKEMIFSPKNKFSAMLIGKKNIFSANTIKKILKFGNTINIKENTNDLFLVHDEFININSKDAKIIGKVIELKEMGEYQEIAIDIGIILFIRRIIRHSFKKGEKIRLELRPGSITRLKQQ